VNNIINISETCFTANGSIKISVTVYNLFLTTQISEFEIVLARGMEKFF